MNGPRVVGREDLNSPVLRRQLCKPEQADWQIEEGYKGRPIPAEGTKDDQVNVHPGNLLRHKPRVQIANVKEVLKRLTNTLLYWNKVAATFYTPGQHSVADDVLDCIWEHLNLRLAQLRCQWLCSKIPVYPVTGWDLEGEEEMLEAI